MFSSHYSPSSQTMQWTLTRKPTDPFNVIVPHIYVGSIDSLKTPYFFQLIVNCTKHIPAVEGKETIRIPIDDDISETNKLLSFINDTHILEKIHRYVLLKRNVLIHCHAGMQRSCAVAAMYLMKYHDLTPEKVIQLLPTRRIIAFYPKPTFKDALYSFYNSLHPSRV